MFSNWKYGVFMLLGGLLVSVHLSHWMMPVAEPIIPIRPGEWISTPTPAARGYFRQKVDVPFTPVHAWLAIAADDYILYVNGQQAGSDIHITNSGIAFQS